MLKGEVQIILKNAYTNEIEYTSDVVENAFLHNHYFGNHPGWEHDYSDASNILGSNIPAGNRYAVSVSIGGYAFVVGDEYISTFDRTVFSLPGNWSKPRDITGTPSVTMSFDNETATVTVLRELAPPLSTTTRNINSISLVRDNSVNDFTFISCASFPSTIVQSNTQVAVIQYVISITAPASTDRSWYDVYHDMLFRFGLILNSTGSTNSWWFGTPFGNRDILGSVSSNASFSSVGNIFNPTKDRGGSWTGSFVSERPNIASYPLFSSSNSGSAVASGDHYMGWDGLIVGEYTTTTGTGLLGSILGSINVGAPSAASHWMLWNSVIPPDFSKTQSYQTKINLPTTPFFIVSEIPTTDATLILNTENYNPRIPEYWKIDFSGSTGGVGVAEYSFMKRYFTGWTDNTFTPRAIDVIGQSQENNEDASSEKPDGVFNYGPMYKVDNDTSAWSAGSGQVWEADELYKNNDIYRVKVTSKEIIFSNFVDSLFKRINSTNYPAFTVSYISAYEYDELSDSFWLACPLTGLWRITDPLGSISITNFNLASLPDVSSTTENKAYSLALGTSQTTHRTVWAFIKGALVKSTNNGTSWTAYDSSSVGGVTFTQANIEADWGNVIAVNADKQTDNRLLVIFNKTTSTASYEGTFLNKTHAVWWSSTSDTTPLLSTDYPLSFMTESGGGGATNYLTGSKGWGVTQEQSNVGFGTASVNYPASSSLIRKRIKKRFGCTKTQSKWWLSNCWGIKELEGDVDQRDGMTPIEIFFEVQIDTGSPGYSKFPLTWSTSGLSIGYNSSTGTLPYLRNFGLVNRVYTNGVLEGTSSTYNQEGFFFYETVDDDGNDSLIWAPSNFANNIILGFYKLDFSDHSLTLLQSRTTDREYYLGRGLFINAEARLEAVGDSFYGWDTAAQLIGEVWERYKWNGASWVRRQDDNDPLGVKSTHSSTDALIGGATISFDDATGTQSYTSGELISVAVCDGIQHDGLTSLDFFAPVVSYYPSDLVSLSTTLGLSTPSEFIPFFLSDSLGVNDSLSTFTANTTNPGDFASFNTDTTVITKVRLGTGSQLPLMYSNTQRTDIGTPFWASAIRLQGTFSSSTDTEYFLSTRLKTSSAASSDVSLITQPFSDVDGTNWLNHAVVNLQDTWNSPPTVGVERQLAWGLTDSTLYSDAVSPEDQNTNVDSFSDITYGFRLRIVENPTENHPNAPAGTQQTSTDTGINDYTDYPFDAGTLNYSENFTSIRYALPILIEVIEGGSVVYSTTERQSQIFIQEQTNNGSGSYYDGSLQTGFRGPIAETAGNNTTYSMFMFPKYSFCPFKIERTGTTVKYYIRGLLVHTSAATSSETLIPCTVKYHNGIGTDTNNQAEITDTNGAYHSFKKAATNDYWVKVGEASPATGAYRTDFSHLQAAYRQTYSITIDGTEANVIGLDNAATLAAGEVSIYPQEGYLRFAAADAGKTIAISMPCAYYDAT